MNAPQTPFFCRLIHGFEGWMRTLGYAPSTVYGSVRFTEEFLGFLEKQQIERLDGIGQENIEDYVLYLQQRQNHIRNGALSLNTITININAVRRFARYLRETGKYSLEVTVNIPKAQCKPERMILSIKEIKSLYRATDESPLGLRDRAMLGIYYGCGLRRSEGVALELQHVDMQRDMLFVRRGKGYSERYVPFSESIKRDFAAWLAVRGQLIANPLEKAFLIGVTGKPLQGPAIMDRVKRLSTLARLDPSTGLHTLRHSIATHLLKGGMSLENVSRFLGHRSLETTQIYTHLVNESYAKL